VFWHKRTGAQKLRSPRAQECSSTGALYEWEFRSGEKLSNFANYCGRESRSALAQEDRSAKAQESKSAGVQ